MEIAKKLKNNHSFKKYYVQSLSYRKNINKLNFPSNSINYRNNPDYYIYIPNILGIFVIQPYTDEIVPIIKISSVDIFKESLQKLTDLFMMYLDNKDYIGSDMVRKYIQFIVTQSKAYYNKNKKNILVNNNIPYYPNLYGNPQALEIVKLSEKLLDTIKNNNMYVNWILIQNYMITDPYKPDSYIFK